MAYQMSDLDASAGKLDAALRRLEGLIDQIVDRAGDPDAARRALDALAADRAAMAEELDAALARERELQALADEASAALGTAIEEVRTAMNQGEG